MRVVIRKVRGMGWRWLVVAGGQVLLSGICNTRAEARLEGNVAVEELLFV